MRQPLVSIITATYNSQQHIAATIESVLDQGYATWELIIIDDASSDATVAIVESYIKKESRIKLLHNAINSGAAVTRNKGIQEAKGQYIAFLDGDDLWKPSKLEKQVAFMQEKNCAISYASYEWIDEEGNPLNVQVNVLSKLSPKKIKRSNYIGNLTGMYDVSKLGKMYAPLLRKRQDWGLWINTIERAKVAYGIQESLAYYRVRQGSISSDKLDLVRYNYQVYHKALGYNALVSLFCLLGFFLEHFFVKKKLIIDKTKN